MTYQPLSSEQERIARELRTSIGLPRRPRSGMRLGTAIGVLVGLAVLYPPYAAAMIAMEAALFLDMPFRDAWDRIWVRWLLFVSFCYAMLGVTAGIKALIKWVKD